MPCWRMISQQTVRGDLSGCDLDHVAEGLRAEGWHVYRRRDGGMVVVKGTIKGTIRGDGQVVLVGQGADLNEIKRAYSRQVIAATAKRYGWKQTRTSDRRGKMER